MKYFKINTNKQDIFDIITEYIDKELAPTVKESLTHGNYQSFRNEYTSKLFKEINEVIYFNNQSN